MSSAQEEGFRLLIEGKINDFNAWRMMSKNLTVKFDFSDRDFSGKDLSGAFLNGLIGDRANFAHATLIGTNLVQASLNGAQFQEANLTETLLMYAEMKGARLANANLTKTNMMWANLQDADLTGSKLSKTVFVEANLQNAKVSTNDKAGAYIRYAKLEGTSWFEQVA
ncbi:MAG: pentapeptide repeat-containing protein [Thermoproteota archaeon]|nr:pentapeptide repeat-containing protein [Thermoproteota archaeon]